MAIPRWTFFAPRPGRRDHRLVVASFDRGDIQVGPWREVSGHENRTLLHALWNPQKRLRKALIDHASSLQQFQALGIGANIQATWQYITLLAVVLRAEVASDNHRVHDYIRFMIVLTAGFDGSGDVIMGLASHLHTVGKDGDF